MAADERPKRSFSNEEAFQALLRIWKRIKQDAEDGNDYANLVLKEEVFDRK